MNHDLLTTLAIRCLLQKVHYQFYHGFLFFRSGFGNHQSDCNQGAVGNDLPMINNQMVVFVQKFKKNRSTDSFASIRKWMVLDLEIKQVGCLFFDAWIYFCTKYILVYSRQYTIEFTSLFFNTKYIRFKSHAVNQGSTFLVG